MFAERSDKALESQINRNTHDTAYLLPGHLHPGIEQTGQMKKQTAFASWDEEDWDILLEDLQQDRMVAVPLEGASLLATGLAVARRARQEEDMRLALRSDGTKLLIHKKTASGIEVQQPAQHVVPSPIESTTVAAVSHT